MLHSKSYMKGYTMKISVIHGDITELNVDIIVNAAKSSLRGGSGVDGAIHAKAGKQLLEECINIGGCMTGNAVITKGYNLPAKHVIHTVGPVWQDGKNQEKEMLTSCYNESLKLAETVNAKTIAFPCISTGVYGFPAKEAAKIAISVVKQFESSSVEQVIFCCYLERDYKLYKILLSNNIIQKIFLYFQK